MGENSFFFFDIEMYARVNAREIKFILMAAERKVECSLFVCKMRKTLSLTFILLKEELYI